MSKHRFIPDDYEEYYYINDSGGIDWSVGDNEHTKERLKIGNVFRTEEEAERMLIKIKAYVIKKDEKEKNV